MWNRILVPTDFSDSARNALAVACDLARRFDASVTLLNVYQVPGVIYPEGFIPASPETYNKLLDETAAALGALKAEAERLGCSRVETRALEGTVFDEIVREAKDHDVIVIGTHGRTGVSHVLLGSVAEHVVRLAPCPVLTVRLPKAERARAGKKTFEARP